MSSNTQEVNKLQLQMEKLQLKLEQAKIEDANRHKIPQLAREVLELNDRLKSELGTVWELRLYKGTKKQDYHTLANGQPAPAPATPETSAPAQEASTSSNASNNDLADNFDIEDISVGLCVGDTDKAVEFRQGISQIMKRALIPGTTEPHPRHYIHTIDILEKYDWKLCKKTDLSTLFTKMANEQFGQSYKQRNGRRAFIGFIFNDDIENEEDPDFNPEGIDMKDPEFIEAMNIAAMRDN